MPAKFANETTVSASRSRAEIEQLVFKYAGRDTNFSYGQIAGQAAIMFVAYGRRVKFTIPLPTEEEGKVAARRKGSSLEPTKERIEAWRDKEERRRWRALLLIIKAKLESVESKASTFDEEFLSRIIPDGGDKTIYERITSTAGELRKLLPPVAKDIRS